MTWQGQGSNRGHTGSEPLPRLALCRPQVDLGLQVGKAGVTLMQGSDLPNHALISPALSNPALPVLSASWEQVTLAS